MGLLSPATFIAVHSYFSTRRGQAVGLAMAGTGIGQMVMPHVVRVLLEWYGFRGCVLIMGALALNGVAGSLLFQPVEWHMRGAVRNIEAIEAVANKEAAPIEIVAAKSPPELPVSCMTSVCRAIDVSLFRDPVFCSITVGLSLVYAASINFSMIFPYFLQVSSPRA